MIQSARTAAVIIPAAVLTLACAAPPEGIENATGDKHSGSAHAGDKDVSDTSKDGPSRRFADLDTYLAWLEQRAKLGGPWYKEVRPGVYELQTGNLHRPGGDRRQRVFTRQELAERFGFAR